MKQTNKLTLKQIKSIEGWDYLEDYCYYLKLKDNSELIVKRRGKCVGTKCKAACCKFFNLGPSSSKYNEGFGEKTPHGIKIPIKCKYLKNNRCSRWNKLPKVCKQFPHPLDSTYHQVFNVCTFYFEIIKIIKEAKNETNK